MLFLFERIAPITATTVSYTHLLEYDILVEHFFEGGEAFGMAALATIDDEGYDYKFSQYTLPLRDNFNSSEFPDKWDAWDEMCIRDRDWTVPSQRAFQK